MRIRFMVSSWLIRIMSRVFSDDFLMSWAEGEPIWLKLKLDKDWIETGLK
jgi:hypothetical protein